MDIPTARIAVVDDHRLFLMGFSFLLERLPRVCAPTPFDTPAELLDALQEGQRFDLVICDLLMRGMNGLAFVAALRGGLQGGEAIPVLMISGISTPPPLREIEKLGAQGFVHKSADDEVLLEAIETVLSGKSYFAASDHAEPDLSVQCFGDLTMAAGTNTAVPSLTPRQHEILLLMSNGAANKEIARALAISENTVKTHLRQIFVLLQVNKRTACVRAAHSLGII